MRISIKRSSLSVENIMIVLLVCYFFFYPLILYVFNSLLCYLILGICAAMALYTIVRCNIAKFNKESMRWLLFLALTLVNNQSLAHKSYLWPFAYITALLIAVAISKRYIWLENAYKVIPVFGFVYVIGTFFFLAFPSLYSVMIDIWGYIPSGTENGTLGYRSGFADNYSANGIYIAVVALVLWTLIFCRKKKDEKLKVNKKLVIASGFVVIALLLTAKRAHLLFSVVSVAISYFLISKKKLTSKLSKFIGLALVAIIGYYWLSYYVPALGDTFARFMETDDISNGRYQLWGLAYSSFLEHPIMGIGWCGFRYMDASKSYALAGGYVDAHNVYIQLLCETGVIGFAICINIILSTYIKSFRLIRNFGQQLTSDEFGSMAVSISLQTFVILYSFTGNCLYDRTFLIYLFACAIQMSISYKLKTNRNVIKSAKRNVIY
ncbi:O-antigen ligase family protein [Desulfosporosinus sp. BG]|uniref:O-antigen ligase family protein n=1 Tax=Desulfosporosinus sp. BG TaxID=1633135 RepID=UPI00083B4801|nr:O-antigen ligase family protein [Desulfosporosinus sp. BG]ODA39135.1 Exopolysaccharide production protein ExoQ [Desulfosporosinus sp. BG]